MCRQNDRFDGVYFKAYREDGQFSDGIRAAGVVKMPSAAADCLLWRKMLSFK
ncbi:hypothetical protein NEIPOLOT_00767 [Neisseria polysaccharea ATCC 43768]|uniref:hypothetical protein n=1 Tax=Neisseria polysaccharea TaxID=489 RepID=UPI0001D9DEF4|nr:hypothetical protein [Neisseria polysaccharea]EFH23375.1 hypothetical protein NEIPOLOT_00767 [Neisseria polysaccharea ATCC 43768]